MLLQFYIFPLWIKRVVYSSQGRRNIKVTTREKHDKQHSPRTLSVVDAWTVPATFRTEQTYCAESEGCTAMNTKEPFVTSYPVSCSKTWPSSPRTDHWTSGSGKAEYLQVNVTFVPDSTSIVPPSGRTRASLLYQETVASDVVILGRVASTKLTKIMYS